MMPNRTRGDGLFVFIRVEMMNDKEASTIMDKSTFTGKIISIQPRIRLTRSFDEASHNNTLAMPLS